MRLVRLPARFAKFKHGGDFCYIYAPTQNIDEATAMAMYNECFDLIRNSDRPSRNVVVVFLMNGRIHSTGHANWIPLVDTLLKEQFDDMPSGKDRDQLLMTFLVRESDCEMNVFGSFRPIADFVTSFNGEQGEGLDPEQYDWREYVRRGLLR